jgi:hypothetical protein
MHILVCCKCNAWGSRGHAAWVHMHRYSTWLRIIVLVSPNFLQRVILVCSIYLVCCICLCISLTATGVIAMKGESSFSASQADLTGLPRRQTRDGKWSDRPTLDRVVDCGSGCTVIDFRAIPIGSTDRREKTLKTAGPLDVIDICFPVSQYEGPK